MINIPCPSCGCQDCDAETKNGTKVKIEICRCNNGSGEFDITITQENEVEPIYEKYQCSEEEIESTLVNRFDINLGSMNHRCFN
ncbi:MAG: hypothetical protein IPL20_00165 [Saprospiraceae bacterium]|nr:hypothetical protein [Saprospiraceae bacterium]